MGSMEVPESLELCFQEPAAHNPILSSACGFGVYSPSHHERELVMGRRLQARVAYAVLAAAATFAPAWAKSQPAPPLIQQLNNGNWLPQQEAEGLRDELFYQRAIHAYMTMLPALNTIGMRDG